MICVSASADEGRNPTRRHAAGLGTAHGIGEARIAGIVAQISAAVARWPEIAGETGVGQASRNGISQRLRAIHVRFTACANRASQSASVPFSCLRMHKARYRDSRARSRASLPAAEMLDRAARAKPGTIGTTAHATSSSRPSVIQRE